ncbi:MAG: hypothetical protein J6A75_02245 [Lachnospiraceae bacterium]|nr:hypothetical protein [Lachnospiraceae bacterium]
MEKNTRLADIYIKIYNKQTLLMEDLRFLAIFDKECFEKTCKNLIYNIPETQKLMTPEKKEAIEAVVPRENTEDMAEEVKKEAAPINEESHMSESIETLLNNLKGMEWEQDVFLDVPVEDVKNLLGSLYMEMLFPHNDKFRYFNLEENIESSIFNKKA